ncbi:putative ddt domain-containing protein [Erysiphe neolycopersici]|uniref:Putative ddt domain-containing protein n=1 Tax=Erysiphe neolycopersici TaxID=212602 RepID=A0A420I1H0_9PEZI|nr:putative ddt domain-containing protein [Erysiphe neolycopersici]
MVLFKRKPVQYLALPRIENDETEVWEIKQTGEIFVDYESYLARMEFYKQRRFICQITGHSGLTFFEALISEQAGAQEVEEAFPEALKGPILRRVQFQTISRIDNLVDLIYEEFRGDYYPGEIVTVHVVTGERLTGVVRDKTSFGAKVLPDGTINPPFSRYFVSLDNRPKEEAVVDEAHISRDRKIFTKQVLRSFIKKSVTRESWTGAPWQVKHDVAKKYHIDIRIPHHLLFANKVNERKNKISQSKKTSNNDGKAWDSQRKSIQNGRHSELKVVLETQKSKQNLCKQQIKNKKQMSSSNSVQPNCSPQTTDQIPFVSHTFQVLAPHLQLEPHSANFHNSIFSFASLNSLPQLANPISQVKYPIDDLQVPPRLNGLKRPALKFLSQDLPSSSKTVIQAVRGIKMKSVGGLLETWDLLNVFCEVLVLDSFTFDDFVEAMQLSSEHIFECELFTEIHCALLKMLVDSEQDGGKVLVSLPEMEQDRGIKDEAGDRNLVPTPTLDLDLKPRGRTTRSSMARTELASPPKIVHRGAEVYTKINWIDELRNRKFDDGGWQFILIGLLYQLSKNPRYHDICENLLQELAPHNLEPTPDTAQKRYSNLNVNLRIQVLEILCMLIVDTQAIRYYMEECSEQMTCFRKEKIQWQRDRKQYLEELRILNEELNTLLPSEIPLSPNSEKRDLYKIISRNIDGQNLVVENDVIDTDEDLRPIRCLRGGQDRNHERKRKRKAQLEKRDKAEPDSKKSKNARQYAKVLKEIQKKQESVAKCESEISILDNDLREADCPRTRILGRDRFWNRYFWFERNGMPYGGLPDSSTAHADYANGCLWIQGPGDLEREGFIEMKDELQNEYMEKFKMTVPERKKNEEGSTSVFNVFQWGYYEDPEAVDELIAWLDIRGCNEQKLHKELTLYRDRINSNMMKRKKYLKSWHDEIPETNTRRVATRCREPSTKNLKYRCLAWRNHIALSKIGHLHSEQPRTRRSKKGTQYPNESERPSKNDTKNKNNKRKLSAR